jgi:chloride channel protein, CIC family
VDGSDKLGDTRPLFGGDRTYRLVLLCVAVGVIGGIAAIVFNVVVEFAQRWLLEGVGHYRPPGTGSLDPIVEVPVGLHRLWLPVVTTLGGLLSGFIVYRWAPEAEGHGTDAAIGAYHRRGGEIRARIPLIKAVASALTIGSGGVAGREGPTAQISVGLGTQLARWAGLRGQERRSVLLASMAAGLAAMFRAPLGMAIFSVEILYSGMVFESEALIYTVISAVTAYAFYGFFAGWSRLFEIPGNLVIHEPAGLLAFIPLGILAGLLGSVLPRMLYWIRDLFAKLPGPPHIRPAVGGLMVGLLAIAAPQMLGTGYGWVELAMAGKLTLSAVLILLLLKGPGMALTIGSGGSGGVFAPTVTLGGLLGAAVGMTVGPLVPGGPLPVASFVVVGMAAVFSCAARTPISTVIMVAEMTGGYGLIVPAMLVNVLAFLTQRALTAHSKYPTLYESQVEMREDSPLHQGVFVRRALEMLETGSLEAADVRLPRLVNLLRFGEPVPVGEGGAMLVTVSVHAGSALAGRTVAEVFADLHGATAVAVLRGRELVAPRGATEFTPGDQVLCVSVEDAYQRLMAMAESHPAAGEGLSS